MAFKIGNQTVIQDIDATAAIETNSDLDKLQIGGVDVFTHDGASPPKITLKNVDIADLMESSINTDNITEGSTNIFHTTARVQAVIDTNTAGFVTPGADIDFGSHKILYSNVYSNLSNLPSASAYHGMFAHVHATGKGYFAHSGNWVELANASDLTGYATTVYVDQSENDAKAYTDIRETAITTAYESYADTAEANAISTASTDATTKANQAETDAINTAAADATTKADQAEADAKVYTDTEIATVLPLTGGTLTGALTLSGAPSNANNAATKAYVDSAISGGTTSLDTDDIDEGSTNLYYTDARVNTVLGTSGYATESYADTAEADAISTASADATTKADAALVDAKAYTDTRETAITTAYESYADTAEADAVTTANAYTDTRETAITTAYESYADQAEADAKAYTDTEVAAIVDGAPGTLDTLNELAAALGDDANLSTTLSTQIGTKVAKAGDTMTGALTLSGAPSSANHAATKAYVDSSVSGGTGALDTDDIAEAGNLYYTDARVNTIFNAKTTSDLTEGTNLYYTNARVDARIPTNVSSFTNDSSYATTSQLFSGSYTDLSNKPTIPTNNNQLTNGAGYITSFTNTTYTAGTGLNLVGTEFQNTAPDQTVSLTGSGATSISGTYPNFTISSTDTNTDTNTTYTAGNGLTLTGTEFKMSGSYTGDFGVTGELSVGTLTPGQELTVQSTNPGVRLNDTTITGLYHDMVSFGDNLRFNADVGNVDADTQIQFYIDNTEKMVLSSSALSVTGEITASGDVTAFSDERLKSNITTIEDALDKVNAMRGVMFDKTDSLSGDLRQSIGVIAQEVEQVLPEVVHNDSNTGYKSVAYGNIVGVLIEAIKEQQSQIENLIQEVEFLKGKR